MKKKHLNEWTISWFTDVIKDREGNLWIATENGLIQFYGEVFRDFSAELPPFVWSICRR